MTPFFPTRRAIFSSLSLCLLLAVSPALASNSLPSVAQGAKILKGELPGSEPLGKIPCETLAQAVHRATMHDRDHAASIFLAALTGGEEPGSARAAKRDCKCVTRLFHAAYTAAPSQAAPLMEQAAMLYPDCADELGAMIENANDKNVVGATNNPGNAGKSGVNSQDNANGTAGQAGVDANGNPIGGVASGVSAVAPPGDGIAAENNDLAAASGFGVGFGPGFPGSPGFTGSAPGGGLALPPASPQPVTSVTNE